MTVQALLLFAPFVVAGLLALLPFPGVRRFAGVAAVVGCAFALLGAILATAGWLQFGGSGAVTVPLWSWMDLKAAGRSATITFSLYFDGLSILLALIVSCISLLVFIYSTEYLHGHPGFQRFFAGISFFAGSMLALVLSGNLVQLFFFWELVGLGSFLLIGFYFERESAVAASKKAFYTTRFADFFFLVGLLILLGSGMSLDFATLAEEAVGTPRPALLLGFSCVAIGAIGKSALLPLHVWLPDAMAGPTPVSALLHAATMVVAGVFLLARLEPALVLVPELLTALGWLGGATAAVAALFACVERDLKRVLAYSTLSQIGYMVAVLQVPSSEAVTASMFHLTTHAFFKALLFLSAGVVLHSVHTNDLSDMGGLRNGLPRTAALFAIGGLALAAFPPYLVAGFFSKEAILTLLVAEGRWGLTGLLLISAGLTAFYITRAYLLCFEGRYRGGSSLEKVHEPGWAMGVPLIVLGALSVVGGLFPVVKLGAPFTELGHHHGALAVLVISLLLAVLGMSVAWHRYGRLGLEGVRISPALRPAYYVLSRKLFFDELYEQLYKRVFLGVLARGADTVEILGVEGAIARTTGAFSSAKRVAHLVANGLIHRYALLFVVGTGIYLVVAGWVK